MLKKKFNIMVIGLTGMCERYSYRVGKSLFCNRFVRSSFDNMILEHDSFYDDQYISGPVIANDDFLFWGFLPMRTDESNESVDFYIFEYTNLRNYDTPAISIQKYLEKAIVTKISAKNKIMYISPEQVKKVNMYAKELMPSTVKIDGFIIMFNADPGIEYKDCQNAFIGAAIKNIEKIKKPFIIVATKCDLVAEKSFISSSISYMFKDDKNYQNIKIHIIETSALLNVNIISAVQTLYSLSIQTPIKIKSFFEANRTLENRTNKLIDAFSNLILNSNEPLDRYEFENFVENNQNSFKIKSVIEIMGLENTKNLFNDIKIKKISKIKEKVLQYCLSKFENCISETFKTFEEFEKIRNLSNFIEQIKNTQTYEENFDTTITKWDNLSKLQEFEAKISHKGAMIKIPIFMIKNERFSVLFEKLKSHAISKSKEQKMKQIYEESFKELVRRNKFNINSSFKDVQERAISIIPIEMASAIHDTLFKDVYDTYRHKILLKSKYQLHELLFEYSEAISNITYYSKTQLIKDIADVIQHDLRFKVFDESHEILRGNWIFSHFTFFRSNVFCLFSPLAPCAEKQATSILSSLFDQTGESTNSEEHDETMILFILTSDEIYTYFYNEFIKFANFENGGKYYKIYINGNSRRIILIKINNSNVDWEDIFYKYSDNKFAFVALYGDSNSYKFIEVVLADICSFFSKIWKCGANIKDSEMQNVIEKVPGISSTINNIYILSNIAILFCLQSEIVDEFKTFLSGFQDSTFLQESMLGRLVELGRNLSSKYNAKFIEPFLDLIINQDSVCPLHEYQVIDSIKYLEEVVYDRPNSLDEKYSNFNRIKILMCFMCGDNFSLDMVIGMILYDRKYEYSNRKQTLYFEHEIQTQKYLVVLRIVSYHSAFILVNKETFHGGVLAFQTNRDCSFKLLKYFASKSRINHFQILGISGELSHSKIIIQKTILCSELAKYRRDELLRNSYEQMGISEQSKNFDILIDNSYEILLKEGKNMESNVPSCISQAVSSNKKYGTFQLRNKKKLKIVDFDKNDVKEPEKNGDFKKDSLASNIDDESSVFKFESSADLSSPSKLKYRKNSSASVSRIKNLMDFTSRLFTSVTPRGNQSQSDSVKNDNKNMVLPVDSKYQNNSHSEMEKSKNYMTMGSRSSKSGKYKNKQTHEDKMLEWEKKLKQQKNNVKYNYFGKSFDDVTKEFNIPLFVVKCVGFIEEIGMDVEGIYRKSGNKSDIETLKMAFETNVNIDFSSLGFNVHVFTGALKSFFNLLPKSFIPENLLGDIVEATGQTDPELRIIKLHDLMKKLSEPVKETLKFIICHFSRVIQRKENNKMDARNLAICFWPNLIKFAPMDQTKTLQLGDNIFYCIFINTLIENYDKILTDEENENQISSNKYSTTGSINKTDVLKSFEQVLEI